MPRPKLRTPELREQVLRAAVATLAEVGVAGFTTRRVAAEADTSIAAVYELFGDRAGLVREMFFDGFRQLHARFDRIRLTDDPRADLLRIAATYRRFMRDNPALAQLMFSRPFSDFGPAREDAEAGTASRRFIVDQVDRAVNAGIIDGDPTDIAHVLLALAQGLAVQESGGWLGSTKASTDRRWRLAFEATLDGFARAGAKSRRAR